MKVARKSKAVDAGFRIKFRHELKKMVLSRLCLFAGRINLFAPEVRVEIGFFFGEVDVAFVVASGLGFGDGSSHAASAGEGVSSGGGAHVIVLPFEVVRVEGDGLGGGI